MNTKFEYVKKYYCFRGGSWVTCSENEFFKAYSLSVADVRRYGFNGQSVTNIMLGNSDCYRCISYYKEVNIFE